MHAVSFTPDGWLPPNYLDVRAWGVKSHVERGDASPVGLFRVQGAWKAAFDASGRRLVTTGLEGNVSLWDIGTGQQVMTLRSGFGQVTALTFSPDGTRVAAAGLDRTDSVIKVWDGRPR
jgi:WD40 repeat protein